MSVKTGGRTKGTPNKDKQALRDRLAEQYPDYDPLLALAKIANDESTELPIQIDCHKAIASYIHPKLKAVETTVQSNFGDELRTALEMTDDELAAIIQSG